MYIDESVFEALLHRIDAEDSNRDQTFHLDLHIALFGGLPRYDGDDCPEYVPKYHQSLEAAIDLIDRFFPDWGRRAYKPSKLAGKNPRNFSYRVELLPAQDSLIYRNGYEIFGGAHQSHEAIAYLAAFLEAMIVRAREAD